MTNVWLKYLPILRIILKRALTEEQQFALNVPDFERAGFKRKSGYKFFIRLKDGRLDNVLVDTPIASSLASTLLEDPAIRELVQTNELHISMNAKFQLTIRHVPQAEAVVQEPAATVA
ncbi:MAG TPA: hypothetical protein VGN63_12175 [Flavisolibacter sp.]|nr:hypothetical protein [Flavisolibacter sp.]